MAHRIRWSYFMVISTGISSLFKKVRYLDSESTLCSMCSMPLSFLTLTQQDTKISLFRIRKPKFYWSKKNRISSFFCDPAISVSFWLSEVHGYRKIYPPHVYNGMELRVGSNVILFLYILLLLIWHMYFFGVCILYIVSCHNYMYYVCET